MKEDCKHPNCNCEWAPWGARVCMFLPDEKPSREEALKAEKDEEGYYNYEYKLLVCTKREHKADEIPAIILNALHDDERQILLSPVHQIKT